MKQALFTLALLLSVPAVADAGSAINTWPNIAQNRALDSLACAVAPLMRTDQDHNCAATSAWTSGNWAAECRFVMAFNGKKTVFHLEGNYDAQHNFSGIISQTLPTCTGFLCAIIGSATWYGHSPLPLAQYQYTWAGTGNTAGCEVDYHAGHGLSGLFFGSY